MNDNSFSLSHSVDRAPYKMPWALHNHDGFELYLFIRGDTEYIVEGIVYDLMPYDLIIIPPDIMHRAVHKSDTEYERFVINIENSFFSENKCEYYLKALNRSTPKIDGDIVLSSGIADALSRLLTLTNDFTYENTAVYQAVLIEILHMLSSIDDTQNGVHEENRIHEIITYINNHYTEKIQLDELAEKIFISKCHMCRIFKEATGYTLVGYINHTRITNVRRMCRTGMNIGEACERSGFGNYTNFYKAFIKENGVSPKYGIK